MYTCVHPNIAISSYSKAAKAELGKTMNRPFEPKHRWRKREESDRPFDIFSLLFNQFCGFCLSPCLEMHPSQDVDATILNFAAEIQVIKFQVLSRRRRLIVPVGRASAGAGAEASRTFPRPAIRSEGDPLRRLQRTAALLGVARTTDGDVLVRAADQLDLEHRRRHDDERSRALVQSLSNMDKLMVDFPCLPIL